MVGPPQSMCGQASIDCFLRGKAVAAQGGGCGVSGKSLARPSQSTLVHTRAGRTGKAARGVGAILSVYTRTAEIGKAARRVGSGNVCAVKNVCAVNVHFGGISVCAEGNVCAVTFQFGGSNVCAGVLNFGQVFLRGQYLRGYASICAGVGSLSYIRLSHQK